MEAARNTKSVAEHDRMNFILIALGTLFFLNPTVGLFDILPDAIGALLIVFGISGAVHLDDRLKNSLKRLFSIAIESIVKFMAAVTGLITDGSMGLLLTFAFSAFEVIVISFAVSDIVSGIASLRIRYGVVWHEDVKKRLDISRLRTPLTAFVLVRTVVCFLPELTELRITRSSASKGELSEYKPMLYGVILIPLTVVFILLSVRCFKAFSALRSDGEMAERIKTEISDVAVARPLEYCSFRLSVATVLFSTSVLLSESLYIDDRDVITKVLTAVFCVLFLFVFSKEDKRSLVLGGAFAGVLAILSSVLSALRSNYFEDLTEENALWIESAASEYAIISVVTFFQAVVCFGLVAVTVAVFGKYLLSLISEFGFSKDTYRDAALRRAKRRVLTVFISASVNCTAAALFGFLRPSFPEINTVLIATDILLIASVFFLDTKSLLRE